MSGITAPRPFRSTHPRLLSAEDDASTNKSVTNMTTLQPTESHAAPSTPSWLSRPFHDSSNSYVMEAILFVAGVATIILLVYFLRRRHGRRQRGVAYSKLAQEHHEHQNPFVELNRRYASESRFQLSSDWCAVGGTLTTTTMMTTASMTSMDLFVDNHVLMGILQR